MTDRSIPRLFSLHPLGHLPSMRSDMLGLQMRALREAGDIARLRLGAYDAVMVSSPRYAQEVLVDRQEDYEKSAAITVFMRPVIGDGILASQGSRHRRRRAVVAPAFQANRIARYADDIVSETDKVFAELRAHNQVDIGAVMLRLTLEIVGRTLFNSKVTDEIEAVGRAVSEGSAAVTALLRAPLVLPPTRLIRPGRMLHRVGDELGRIVLRIIEERRASEADPGDVLSMLLSARDGAGEGLTNEELRDEVMTLFLAGHETTANALAWALGLLAMHPECAHKLADEVDTLEGRPPRYEDLPKLPYTLAVFKEALRLYPPAYLLGRQSLTETSIGPHKLPRGQLVFLNVYGIQRRPDPFVEPDEFRPERFLHGAERQWEKGAFLPFGNGPRVCVGNHFALMEGQLVLARFAQGFEIAGSVRTLPVPEPLVTLRPRQALRMHVRPRRSDVLKLAL